MKDNAVELFGVSKNFGKTEIINSVSLQIPKGERVVLIGPNGAGKSTLLNLISGRFAASAGRIFLNGEDITRFKSFEINRRGLSRSFQISSIFHQLSVYENIRCAVLWSLGYGYSFWHLLNRLRDVHERAEQVLEEVGLTNRRNITADMLTYAEQRALEIGITIAGGANVILLDEPTAGMSRSESEAIVMLLQRVTKGRTLLMVEHDMDVVFDLADRIAVLVYGEMIAYDTPAAVRGNVQVQEAYLGHNVAAKA